MAATLAGSLWNYNLAHIKVVDVTDDYRLMQPPLPSDFYPVLREVWLPKHGLANLLPASPLVDGYLYDWHESPNSDEGIWYVGVVAQELAEMLAPPSLERLGISLH